MKRRAETMADHRRLWWALAGIAVLLIVSLLPNLADIDGYYYTFEYFAADRAGTLLLAYLVAAGIIVAFDLRTRFSLIPRVSYGDFVAPTHSHDTEVIEAARNQLTDDPNRRNVVVYRDFKPFEALGVDWGGWSFSVDITRKATDLTDVDAGDPLTFELDDLYRDFTLDIKRGVEPSLRVVDQLYVDGARVRDLQDFLPDIFNRPKSFVPPDVVQLYRNRNHAFCRHYLLVQHQDWAGDIVVSYLLRFVKSETHLFAECHIFVLPPLQHRFKEIDEPEWYRFRIRNLPGIFLSGACKTIFMLPAAPFLVLAHASQPLMDFLEERRARKHLSRIKYNNYGSHSSLRSKFSAQTYGYFNQNSDRQMRIQVTQQKVLYAIIDFLDNHNIDTSDIKDRQTAILNNGVIVAGGALQASSVAVGAGSRAFSASSSNSGTAEKLTHRLHLRAKGKPTA